ncbi:MAG: hypothetical protein AAGE98_04275 [Actinomycetota bacterium]
MQLIITEYLPTRPDAERLEAATVVALDRAAERVARPVAALEHARVAVRDDGPLAVLEITLPWTGDDREGTSLAANEFATSLTRALAA